MTPIDLRSDTVTRPTDAMRQAMAEAEVGDDVFGEDPTVNRLQAAAAEKLGKAAALFVPSGTMANLVCQLAHCGRGDETLLGDQAHVFYYEQGGSSALGGIHPRTIPNQPDGTMDLEALAAAVRPDDLHFPVSRLILLENTHNRCGGAPLPPAYIQEVARLARRYNMKLHIDGARLFNAAAALKVTAAELAAPADSVSICLSKGLAAPVGSLVCGDDDFIAAARRARKQVGGGMRQTGVLAAAGLVALNEMTERLADDHANAARLAEGISRLAGVGIDLRRVRTNIVYFDILRDDLSAAAMVAALEGKGVRMLASGPRQIRAVTHYEITADDIEQALAVMATVL